MAKSHLKRPATASPSRTSAQGPVPAGWRTPLASRSDQLRRLPPALRAGAVRDLQAAAGNQAVTRMLRGGPDAVDAARVESRLQVEVERRAPADQMAGPDVAAALGSPGRPLDDGLRRNMGVAFGYDFRQVRVHTDPVAAESAAGLGAIAYTVGRDIVFGADQYAPGTPSGRRLLAHELGHVVQQDAGAVPPVLAAGLHVERGGEQQAAHWADTVANGGMFAPLQGGRHGPAVMLQIGGIARKVLKYAARRLSRRTVATVSKHIARHARAIAGRAIHSVFRDPRKIRTLIERTFKEASEVAARHASSSTGNVIEEGAIRITRQATRTPGKFRYLIEKLFANPIGTQGERWLRIVLDQTGRIVTAFPADRLATIGLGVAALETFTERTAEAAEVVHEHAKQVAREEEKQDEGSWWEWVPIIGDVWGNELNRGEDAALRRQREVEQVIAETIADVETTEQRSLDAAARQELEQLIRAAITSPLLEDEELEGEDVEPATR
jgi:hypothetical protein